MPARKMDVVGLGLNATDTVLLVQEFPPLGGKEKAAAISRHAGGQVATAMVCCQRLGLKTRYVGKVGDDEGGRLQLESLRKEGVDTEFVLTALDTPNQLGLIIVDRATGERTVFWHRDRRLKVRPSELAPEAFRSAKILLIDGCDVEASLKAGTWARRAGIPVVADFDTLYPGVEELFPHTDYLIASRGFLPAITGESDLFRVLECTAREYHVPVVGVTLGRDGALALAAGKFHYSPGFEVDAADTTGAGDVFHGALIFGILKGWPMDRMLEFSNAMAALNCTNIGARGGIATEAEAERLMASAGRHRHRRYAVAARTPSSAARSAPFRTARRPR